jgi:phosphate transport system substrate-binding protein
MKHKNEVKYTQFIRTLTVGFSIIGLMSISLNAQKVIKISGSVPFKEQYFDNNLAAIKEKTKLSIEVIGNGTDRGISDVIEGRSDAAMLAAPLADIAKKMNEKKTGYVDLSLFKETKIGDCEIVLIVHPSNKIKSLTAAQAIGLLSGTIKNWKEVGGSDQAVVVAVAMPGNGIRTSAEKQLLKDIPFALDARQVTNPAQVATVISQFPGGIGPLGISMLDPKVTKINLTDKKIIAPMLILTKGEPSTDIQAIIKELKNTTGVK